MSSMKKWSERREKQAKKQKEEEAKAAYIEAMTPQEREWYEAKREIYRANGAKSIATRQALAAARKRDVVDVDLLDIKLRENQKQKREAFVREAVKTTDEAIDKIIFERMLEERAGVVNSNNNVEPEEDPGDSLEAFEQKVQLARLQKEREEKELERDNEK